MPFDDAAADAYADVRAAVEREGRPIGPNDMMIAAIAIANGLAVVTHNTGELPTNLRPPAADLEEFRRVPGLLVEDWES